METVLKEYGIEISFTFVPFSQSRNKGKSWKSLNWIVSLSHYGTKFLDFEYSQGIAYAPSYKKHSEEWWMHKAVEYEIESGRSLTWGKIEGVDLSGISFGPEKRIVPEVKDVMEAFLEDCSLVLNTGSFHNFCEELDLNSDSISEKKAYDKLVEDMLKLQYHLGQDTFLQLVKMAREEEET